MKIKSHSGTKKRVKVRKSGRAMIQKAAKRHLLVNKSKRQKKSNKNGIKLTHTRMQDIKRLLPGQITR